MKKKRRKIQTEKSKKGSLNSTENFEFKTSYKDQYGKELIFNGPNKAPIMIMTKKKEKTEAKWWKKKKRFNFDKIYDMGIED